jgi:hypothetical protein
MLDILRSNGHQVATAVTVIGPWRCLPALSVLSAKMISVSGEGFAVDANLFEADIHRQRSIAGKDWHQERAGIIS